MTGFSCGFPLQDDKIVPNASNVANTRVFRAVFLLESMVSNCSSARRILPNQRREEIAPVLVQQLVIPVGAKGWD